MSPVAQLYICGARRKQVDVKCVTLLRVDVARHGCQKPGDVPGTARAAKPRAALMLTVGLERIRVEEQLAVKRHSGDQPVVKRALHNVDVARVAVKQKESMVPVVVADGRAGLVVGGHIRQLVVAAERLT